MKTCPRCGSSNLKKVVFKSKSFSKGASDGMLWGSAAGALTGGAFILPASVIGGFAGGIIKGFNDGGYYKCKSCGNEI